MTQNIEKLLSSEVLSDEAKTAIAEAWEQTMSEAREDITAELREEFASRYENDKAQIVEAMDAMLNDAIKTELDEFAGDKRKLREDRIAYKKAIREHTAKLDKFITSALGKEVAELREDRNKQTKNFTKLEEFVIHKLTEEINEFHIDKKALVEQRVRLTKEGKKAILEAKRNFIKKSAVKVEKILESTINRELTVLKEDIRIAKENNFGRKIYETFATEFMTSALNEGTEVSKLNRKLKEAQAKTVENATIIATKDKAIMESKRLLRIAEDRSVRKEKLSEMLQPLGKDHRAVMSSLLESVATGKLETAFEKYLPTVLTEGSKVTTREKAKLTEGARVLTGNKASRTESETDGSADIIRIRKLAGI
jgi:hypothetical protein